MDILDLVLIYASKSYDSFLAVDADPVIFSRENYVLKAVDIDLSTAASYLTMITVDVTG